MKKKGNICWKECLKFKFNWQYLQGKLIHLIIKNDLFNNDTDYDTKNEKEIKAVGW